MYRGFRSFRHFGRLYRPRYYRRRGSCCCLFIPLTLLLGAATIFAFGALFFGHFL